jgi:dTDP-4-dehydrorhamnose 3,5-epimerase-like enzyme
VEIIKKQYSLHEDPRGKLIAIESLADVPFEIKRIYYIYDTATGTRRGFHCHKELQQYLICVSGSCKILLDDGNEKQIIELNDPSEGLYVGPALWREMFDFSPDAVLLVLASEHYNEDDYIHDYAEFLRYVGKDR